MTLELIHTIDLMLDLYKNPRSIKRFDEYIKKLQGGTMGDLVLPISGFNPMAKDHAIQKLIQLQQLDAEKELKDLLLELNNKLAGQPGRDHFKVALNLADDVMGGWTNRFTSDYDSKFRINAFVARKFCVILYWTSEDYSIDMIRQRAREYIYRTIYFTENRKPITLADHVAQEKFVANETGIPFTYDDEFFQQHKLSDSYAVIFNYFYGDDACRLLNFPTYGSKEHPLNS